MNKNVKISLIVLVTIVLLLAMTSWGFAKNQIEKPEFELTFTLDEWDEFMRNFSGSFDSYGTIEDSGDAYLDLTFNWSIPGFLSFVGKNGAFSAKTMLMIEKYWEEDCRKGKIILLTGTGDYENMTDGLGQIKLCRAYDVNNKFIGLEGTIDGWISIAEE